MAVIRPYLEILKVRMEDRLQADINVPEGLLSAEFPPMMIQTLVENAIKHGLEPKAEGGTLTVAAEIVHGKLAVTVADTGLGFGRADTAGTGIGLANIRERLQAAVRRQGLAGRRRQSAERHGRDDHRALPGAAARRRPLVMNGVAPRRDDPAPGVLRAWSSPSGDGASALVSRCRSTASTVHDATASRSRSSTLCRGRAASSSSSLAVAGGACMRAVVAALSMVGRAALGFGALGLRASGVLAALASLGVVVGVAVRR